MIPPACPPFAPLGLRLRNSNNLLPIRDSQGECWVGSTLPGELQVKLTEARTLESIGRMRALVPARGRLNSAARCAAYLAPVALLGGTAGFYALRAPRSPRGAPV